MTMKQFVKQMMMTIKSERVSVNPNAEDNFQGLHYKVTLKRPKCQMTIYFSMGYGLNYNPTIGMVLSCLISDSISYDNADTFEEWASEYGFDTDSRNAHKTYKTVEKQTERFKKFMGESYDLIYNVDLD